MSQRTVRNLFWFPLFDQLDIAHARGRTQVIHDRVRLVEALRGENVLVGDAHVLIGRPLHVTVKPDVMFQRNLSQSLVIRHCRILLLKLNQLLTLPLSSSPRGEATIWPLTARS